MLHLYENHFSLNISGKRLQIVIFNFTIVNVNLNLKLQMLCLIVCRIPRTSKVEVIAAKIINEIHFILIIIIIITMYLIENPNNGGIPSL